MTFRTPRPHLPSEPGEPAAPGSLITVENGTDILMRRSLEDYAPSAQVNVLEAAQALEDFRLGGGPGALARAEENADRAITAFQIRTGERDVAAWQVAVTYIVELLATRYSAERLSAFDPAPPVPSLFTPVSPMRLEKISYDAHTGILTAARLLERSRREVDEMDVARSQHSIHEAARLLQDELPGLSLPLWVLICRFCAEAHAHTVRGRATTDPAVTS
ncbi:hypothetical protein [Actinacidiphila sp. ITFR-21]|uniref:hypothetical protein n=1 Tax=Actinacidiphila sp. ITFR-21 TaxID=3075199 RepID=UPI00288A4BBA|nr:hypothetical protein [Streptomyces sp. ITFR-21]WNI20039.1 hypothetical protein RLT57_31365 [Streptomyces sp. ITFR-21]